MINVKNNFFQAGKMLTAFIIFGFSISQAQGVFITEIADPQNSSETGRFVELHNSGSEDVDLTGWALRRWTNESVAPQSDKPLEGSIPANGFYIICNDDAKFLATYGFDANLDIGEGGPADGNGDDDLALVNAAGEVVDFYGEANSIRDGNTGTVWEFEDGRAERKGSVTSGNPSGDAAEWNIDNDSGGGAGPQYAPEDFDPGVWNPQDEPTATIDITFNLDMSEVTVDEGGVYVAGGSNFGSPGDFPLTDSDGDGIYSGVVSVPEAIDGAQSNYTFLNGNCSNWSCKENIAGEVCADASNYNDRLIQWSTEDITINACFARCGDGTCSDIPILETIDITFNVDMSEVTVDEAGVSVAGGGVFGTPGENPLTDADGDGVFSGTVTVNANGGANFIYVNGYAGWGGWDAKEQLAGQSCADPENYNDRYLEWGSEDLVVNSCFGRCGEGVCSAIPLDQVEVVFSTDANAHNATLEIPVDVIHVTGSFDNWSGGSVEMTDPDGDGIYVGSTLMLAGTMFEYKYTIGGWALQSGAEIGGPCDWNPNDEYNNYGGIADVDPLILPTYVFGGGCAVSMPQDEGIVFSLSLIHI